MPLTRSLVIAVLLFTPAPLAAQDVPAVAPSASPRLVISRNAITAALPAAGDRTQPPARPRRDSLKNGTIAGAIIGGIVAGVLGGQLCNALAEPGDPPCWRGVLTIGALGAGIGAAAGAGIDALRAHQPYTPRSATVTR